VSRLSGAHAHHGGGAETIGVIAIAVAVVIIAEWILSVIVWIAVALGVLLALAAAVLVWWLRGKPGREAAWAARYADAFAGMNESRKITATVTSQVSAGTQPAIENHVHYHYHAADGREPARVIAAEVEP